MANYKDRQRAAEAAYRARGRVIHTACVMVPVDKLNIVFRRVNVDGTYRVTPVGQKKKTKKEKKLDKKLRILARVLLNQPVETP